LIFFLDELERNVRLWLIQTGPIIRVTPNELHIRDSHFFDEFYGRNLHLDKEGWDTRFGTEGGVLTTVNAAFHKRRRAALSPMYVFHQLAYHVFNRLNFSRLSFSDISSNIM
jgi:hypothetical protein